jgi:hypothetical protein
LFQRVSKTKTLIVGSLESETGSEFLFGYNPQKGLEWLERHGQQFTALDPEWREAESFIAKSSQPAPAPATPVHVETPEMVEAIRPQTVSRSAASEGWDDPYPMEGDSRIVGDLSEDGIDVADDDIAAQAAQFLANLGEE